MRRVRPRAPVKRHSGAAAVIAPGPSPAAVVLRHIGAGADGFGHTPGALAASELFVKHQKNRDAEEHARSLDDNMRALGRAAAQRLSVSRQVQAVDSALAVADADRCRRRLAALSQGRRERLADQQEHSGTASARAGDHMSVRKAVERCKGLQDCTNTLWTPSERLGEANTFLRPFL